MFGDRKKRRKLEKELKEYDDLYFSQFRAAQNAGDYGAVKALYDVETAETVSALRWMQTEELRKRAKKFGIKPQGYHVLYTGEEPYWETNKHTRRTYLSEAGAEKLNQQIVEARFAYWKRWIDILAPTASVIISLLALALAALALYLQAKGTAPAPDLASPTH